jgi:hypothetical protein
MKLYCGVNDQNWNKHPVMPGDYACISPIYGKSEKTKRENRVTIPQNTRIIQDSGAFSDGLNDRLSFPQAFDRQVKHAEKYQYQNQIEAMASYDLLIDEMWEEGKRHKQRWSENDAWFAVNETINAAKFLAKNYSGKRVQSAQGVTPNQYLQCAYQILEYTDFNDIFGLGGWCISGKMPLQMIPHFSRTIWLVIPLIASANIKRVHIWGVMDSEFLGPLLWLCDQYDLILSTDSAGPQLRPVMGEWGYKGWKRPYNVAPVETRGIHRAIHVQLTRCWLKHGLRKSPFYHEPENYNVQKSIFA